MKAAVYIALKVGREGRGRSYGDAGAQDVERTPGVLGLFSSFGREVGGKGSY